MVEDLKVQKYGKPISEDGTINNAYFSIHSDGTNEKDTTKGINEAIKYASKNNIKYIKLETGNYLINGVYNELNIVGGIVLKSNICFDLNNSKIIQVDCKEIKYSMLGLNCIENVVIQNGTIIGDRNNHNYEGIDSTHEWGYGIEIKSCENIEIRNVEILNTTGDGIIITSIYKDGFKISNNIDVNNCNIHSCRRNGISIISATNVEIFENDIHDMQGTSPEAGIILESWGDKQIINEIDINNNRLYDNKIGIDVQSNTKNISIQDNITYDNIEILTTFGMCIVQNNIIYDARLGVLVEQQPYEQGKRINKIIVEENKLNNSQFYALNVENMLLRYNEIINSNISIYSSNCLIDNNILNNEKEDLNWGIRYWVTDFNKEEYNLYLGNNSINGNYKFKESIIDSERVKVHRENLEEYEKEFEKIGDNIE